jgi:hypothetical protein
MQSEWPPRAASMSTVRSSRPAVSHLAFTSAPAAIKDLTQSTFPFSAAHISAVPPLGAFAFTSLPSR